MTVPRFKVDPHWNLWRLYDDMKDTKLFYHVRSKLIRGVSKVAFIKMGSRKYSYNQTELQN